jgi:hypothetical protein
MNTGNNLLYLLASLLLALIIVSGSCRSRACGAFGSPP